MTKRRLNPRLAKIHRSYTVEEIASLYGVHKNTVRTWIKNGLSTCDSQRPTLILGHNLRDFIEERRTKNKRPCPPGTIYCVRCREPKTPLENAVIYIPITETKGNLLGTCSSCNSKMYRLSSLTTLEQLRTHFKIVMAQDDQHISDNS